MSITAKSTKAVMWDAIQELKAEAKKGASKPSIEETVVEAKKVKVVEKATIVVGQDINTEVASLKNALLSEVDKIGDGLNNAKSQYKELLDAIEIKKNEIEELTGVEGELIILQELIDSQRILKESTEAFIEKKENDSIDFVNAQKDELATSKDDWLKERAAEMKRIRTERDRDEEQYEYDFSIRKRNALSALDTEIAKGRKVLADDEAILQGKELDLSGRVDEIKGLQDKVDSIDTLIVDAVKSAKGKAEGMLNSKHKNEIALIEKDHQLAVSNSSNRIEFLEQKVEDQESTITDLRVKLDKAYENSNAVAMKVAASSGNVIVAGDNKK